MGSVAVGVPKPSPLEESAITATLDKQGAEVNGVEHYPSMSQDDELAEIRTEAVGVLDISSAPGEAADQEMQVAGPAMPPPEFFAAAAEANLSVLFCPSEPLPCCACQCTNDCVVNVHHQRAVSVSC